MEKKEIDLTFLDHCFGGGEFTKIPTILGKEYLLSPGVKALADAAGAYWLLDIIFSVQQLDRVVKLDIQFWDIEPDGKGGCFVNCREDSGIDPCYRQHVVYTDFPLDELRFEDISRIWLQGQTVFLPQEY